MNPVDLFEKLITQGGSIVSSNDLTPEEINTARDEGRFAVDENGFGFVHIPEELVE